ncbi:MAG: FAD-binding protein [Rhodobacter sp.]|nr:FAD-binding protein [Rhodobacter sp.]
MSTNNDPDISPVIALARAQGIPCLLSGEGDYEALRPVHNARLQTYPQVIAPCRDETDVAFWLRELQGFVVPISIRSGGHHHEAMCSNTGGVVLITPSEKDIDIDPTNNTIWVGSGQKLRNVIYNLGQHERIMPTGGCGTVNVGGLTHGGGWGMSYRTWGLTSDALLKVEMVLPNGDFVKLDASGFTDGTGTSLDVDPEKLFWAIRGGGGGNFGVVTRFQFRIFAPCPVYTEFTLQWDKAGRHDAALAWVDLCNSDDTNLNTFGRMTVMDDPDHKFWNPPLVIGGRYYGDLAQCHKALAEFLEKAPTEHQYYREKRLDDPADFLDILMLSPDAGPSLADGTPIPPQGFALQVGAPKADGPVSTCIDEPEPHKVSSTMPGGDHDEVFRRAEDYIDNSDDQPDVNMYLSLHGMGGRGAENREGAFPWRDKPYMLQVQAWWNPGSKTEAEEKALVDWVGGFRKALEPACEGAFINFPDRAQDPEQYYGGSWEALRDVKDMVDPKDRLGFLLGVKPH